MKQDAATAAAAGGAGVTTPAVRQDAAAGSDPTDCADLNRTATATTGGRACSRAITSTAAPPLKRDRQVAVTTATAPSSKRDNLVTGRGADEVNATAVPTAAAETAATGGAERASRRRTFASALPRAGTTIATEAAGATGGKKRGCKGLRR